MEFAIRDPWPGATLKGHIHHLNGWQSVKLVDRRFWKKDIEADNYKFSTLHLCDSLQLNIRKMLNGRIGLNGQCMPSVQVETWFMFSTTLLALNEYYETPNMKLLIRNSSFI